MIYSDDGILTVRTYEFYKDADPFEHVVVSHPRKFALEQGIKDEDLTLLMHCDVKVKGWRCRAVDTEVRGFYD
ncbi:hypothetical protein [Escherichia phage PJNS034]